MQWDLPAEAASAQEETVLELSDLTYNSQIRLVRSLLVSRGLCGDLDRLLQFVLLQGQASGGSTLALRSRVVKVSVVEAAKTILLSVHALQCETATWLSIHM